MWWIVGGIVVGAVLLLVVVVLAALGSLRELGFAVRTLRVRLGAATDLAPALEVTEQRAQALQSKLLVVAEQRERRRTHRSDG